LRRNFKVPYRDNMKTAYTITRILIGMMFLFASVGYLLNLFPTPEVEGQVKIFNDGMKASVYLFPTVKVVELLSAISFLSGFYVPLFTVALFPIVVNIVLFHAFLDLKGLVVPLLILAGTLFMVYFNFDSYKCLLSKKPNNS